MLDYNRLPPQMQIQAKFVAEQDVLPYIFDLMIKELEQAQCRMPDMEPVAFKSKYMRLEDKKEIINELRRFFTQLRQKKEV